MGKSVALVLALTLIMGVVVGRPNVAVIGRKLLQRQKYGARIGEKGNVDISEAAAMAIQVPQLYDFFIQNRAHVISVDDQSLGVISARKKCFRVSRLMNLSLLYLLDKI
jgi:hypothetical protein